MTDIHVTGGTPPEAVSPDGDSPGGVASGPVPRPGMAIGAGTGRHSIGWTVVAVGLVLSLAFGALA
ncbi:MAG: hypothetical protein ACHQ02_07815, partial [Candidatus Limnocylindrales bacterium]